MLGIAVRSREKIAWALLFGLAMAFCICANSARGDLPVISNEKAIKNAELPLPKLADVKLGWNGVYRVGSPTALSIHFQSPEEFNGILNVYVIDADGNTIKHGPLHWESRSGNGETKYRLTIQAPKKGFEVKIELKILPLGTEEMRQRREVKSPFDDFPVSAEWTWAAKPELALSSVREVWMEIGSSLKLKNIAAIVAHEGQNQPAVITGNREESFEKSIYEGVSGIAVSSPLYPLPNQGALDLYSIEDWVRSGGNLFLSLSENKESKTERREYFNEKWAKFLGGKITEERVPHTQFSVWENFLGTEEQLGINEELRRNPPLIPVLKDLQAKVLLSDGDTPLVIEHQLGLGRVVTCLVDLNADPWLKWRKRDELLQRLLPWHLTSEAEAKHASSSSSLRLGYDDLAGQFVTALGTFGGIKLTPFWVLMSAALGFGLVWYSFQAFLLKTWSAAARLVLAALVVAAATVAFVLLTGGFTKESLLVANSAQVVDYNAMQGEYQGQSWLSLLSTNPRQIDLQAKANVSSAPIPNSLDEFSQQLEWQGLPGKGWGGLDAPLATWTDGGEPYQISSYRATETGLTLSRDLTKSFHERWRQPTKAVQTAPLVSYHGESLPRGTLKSELPFALHDAILLYDTWGVELGTVQPGQVIDLEQIHARVVAGSAAITGKRAQPTAAVQNYNRAGTDVQEILKLLLLHRAAGGTRYTGLFSRAWPLLDQSGSLTANQALIIGTGPAPVQWKIGAAGEKLEPLKPASEVCWYRLWLPVVSYEQAQESADKPTVIRLPKE